MNRPIIRLLLPERYFFSSDACLSVYLPDCLSFCLPQCRTCFIDCMLLLAPKKHNDRSAHTSGNAHMNLLVVVLAICAHLQSSIDASSFSCNRQYSKWRLGLPKKWVQRLKRSELTGQSMHSSPRGAFLQMPCTCDVLIGLLNKQLNYKQAWSCKYHAPVLHRSVQQAAQLQARLVLSISCTCVALVC